MDMDIRAAGPVARPYYYRPEEKVEGEGAPVLHPLLQDATILRSDHWWVQKTTEVWSRIMNFSVGGFRPILSLFSLFSRSHQQYKNELSAISHLTEALQGQIMNNTHVHGGETDLGYRDLCQEFDEKMKDKPRHVTKIVWHNKSDSLDAADDLSNHVHESFIAITNFANAVRIGGADSVGGKGSQEEQLFRSTCLRVSLEYAHQQSDAGTRSETGRYIPYYGAIVSQDVPSIAGYHSFNYVSAAAPDLRTRFRSEGAYYQRQNDPRLVEEVLRRKLSAVMMGALLHGNQALVLGAFGAGAFHNDPRMVAGVIRELLDSERFNGRFTHVVMPIGENDPNRAPFQAVLGTE